MRIETMIVRGDQIRVVVNGSSVTGFLGESVATVLRAAGLIRLRSSPRAGRPRGVFCSMGVCQECAVRIDGKMVPACLEAARDGMEIVIEGSGYAP